MRQLATIYQFLGILLSNISNCAVTAFLFTSMPSAKITRTETNQPDPLGYMKSNHNTRGSLKRASFKHIDDTDNSENNPSSSTIFTEMRASNNNNSTSLPSTTIPQQEHQNLIISVGVIADIQHAPIPDGFSYGGVPRYYQHALEVAGVAAEHFQKSEVDLVINLGDIIDGKCADVKQNNNKEGSDNSESGSIRGIGLSAINNVIKALSAYDHGPILHTYGNHELYNLDRRQIGELLNIPFIKEKNAELVGYRSHIINNIRFVVLDTYDIAMMGRCPDTSDKRKKAEQILEKHNPNYPQNENSPQNLDGLDKRFVAFNGGIGATQLSWLKSTLAAAKQNNERVIILSHQPILPESSSPVCLVWNYDEVLAIMRKYKGTIIASFSGHAHKGGYKRDTESGIHFRVFEAVLESPDPICTYGFVDIFHHEIRVRGEGRCNDAIYDLTHLDHCHKLPNEALAN